MKLYLLLLNILFASTSFAFEHYHNYNGKYIVTTDCKTIYVCNKIETYSFCANLSVLDCSLAPVKVFSDCVDQSGGAVKNVLRDKSKNPFTECKQSSNYHTAKIKISDCRTSYKKGNSDLSYKIFANNVESRSFNYFTASGVHDRVLTGYGWCKYNNLSGRCGATNGLNCRSGQCCSKYNYCGTTSDYCKKGCQGNFGHCN